MAVTKVDGVIVSAAVFDQHCVVPINQPPPSNSKVPCQTISPGMLIAMWPLRLVTIGFFQGLSLHYHPEQIRSLPSDESHVRIVIHKSGGCKTCVVVTLGIGTDVLVPEQQLSSWQESGVHH